MIVNLVLYTVFYQCLHRSAHVLKIFLSDLSELLKLLNSYLLCIVLWTNFLKKLLNSYLLCCCGGFIFFLNDKITIDLYSIDRHEALSPSCDYEAPRHEALSPSCDYYFHP